MTSRRGAVLLLLSIAAAAAACSKDDGTQQEAPGEKLAKGQTYYAQLCVGCHGARGEGGQGPSLRDEYLKRDEPALVHLIDGKMPLDDPKKCTGDCPEDVATYIFETFRGPIVCDAPKPVARGIRLLTRREYLATVSDLLGVVTTGGAASSAPPCGQITFRYDPKGRALSTVHVAGSFNGWPQTIAGGGWPLAHQPDGTWSLVHTVPTGQSFYKFVLNESEWITDASNPKGAPDGVGGTNSELDVSCSAGGGGGATSLADPTASFPPETRPQGFVFDDNGPGRVVTSDLMSEYVNAAAKLAAAADLGKLVACDKTQRDACTTSFVKDLGKRAFRRPLADTEVARYASVAAKAADFDAGARAVIRALLLAPSFAYRTEVGAPGPGGTFVLTPWEVASALSYYFWGTMPDAALFAAAESGELATTAGIEKHARRLLADPRARATIATFAEQWLGTESLDQMTKADGYPWDPSLRAAMREETRRLVTSVVFDGSHRIDEIFTANYTFANAALAAHYGLPAPAGGDFAKIPYPDAKRAGVLGHASVLAATGHSDQSSPILRGLFVRRRLLCQEFPTPPPQAGSIPKVDPNATTRQRFAQHTANEFCATCHKNIDPVGFGFEHFDTVGRWRDTDSGQPVDASGDMNDVEGLGAGTHAPFSSLSDLGHVLAQSGSAKMCAARQVYRFARGRLDDDICQVKTIADRWNAAGGDLRELLVLVVTDPAFVVRQ